MPELPEVETVKRGLAPVMEGRRFELVEQRRTDLRFPLPEHFAERLEGRRIERLNRRAKYILAHLEGGEILTMHLGMSGRFAISPTGRNGINPLAIARTRDTFEDEGPTHREQFGEFTNADLARFQHDAGNDPAHDHVVFRMEGGATVTYNDARRFGYMSLIGTDELAQHPHFKDLGVEPLENELTPQFLASQAEGRKTNLKAFLMDQRVIAGLGNIYVCEAFNRALLSPKRKASTIADRRGAPNERAVKLTDAIKTVLNEAIEAGGSSLRDHKRTDGELGMFQHNFRVYDREGKLCPTRGCKGTVKRIVQNGRSTFFCPVCQK